MRAHRNEYRPLMGKVFGISSFRGSNMWQSETELGLRDTGFEDVNWTYLMMRLVLPALNRWCLPLRINVVFCILL